MSVKNLIFKQLLIVINLAALHYSTNLLMTVYKLCIYINLLKND